MKDTVRFIPGSRLAKLEPPRLANVVDRPRLFELFDRLTDRRVIWLSAPAGYGKTVATATWLESRSQQALWYHVDDGDADLASFTHFWSLAVGRCVGDPNPGLPVLAPELYGAVPTFVRNYFRAVCARLPRPSWMVLDNFQEIPDASALPALLPVTAWELPEGIGFVIISRDQPGPPWARLRAAQHMAVIDAWDLRLTEEETGRIAARFEEVSGRRSQFSVPQLYSATDGWAAGLALLLRHDGLPFAGRPPERERGEEIVFDYLAAEVLDRLPESVQDFLLRTSCLEHFSTQVARELTGNAAAADILEGLVRGNAFTLYKPESATYSYHPLLRQLLRRRAADAFTPAEQTTLRVTAGRIVAAHDDPEQALELFLQAAAWPEASRQILELAPSLVNQGRFQSLDHWINALPAAVREASGWLSYWLGTAQMAVAFPAARPTFEHACGRFAAAGDRLGQMLSISAILRHLGYACVDLSPSPPWLARLDELLTLDDRFPSASAELEVLAGFFNAAVQALPGHPRIETCLRRLGELARGDVDAHSRAWATVTLLHYFGGCGHTAEFKSLVGDVWTLSQGPEYGPAMRFEVLWLHAYHEYTCGNTDRMQALLSEALAVARHHELAGLELRVHIARLQALDEDSITPEQAAVFAQLEPKLRHAPRMLLAHYQYVQAMRHLARGELSVARDFSERAVQVFQSATWVVGRAMMLIVQAQIECEAEAFAPATALLGESLDIVRGIGIPLLEFNAGLTAAEIARREGREQDFAEALARAFAIGREHGFANMFHRETRLFPGLIPHALQRGIEIAYCRWLIRVRRLPPPAPTVLHWPWPIRIRALGQFEVAIEGEPLRFEGKSQQKPMSILKELLPSPTGVDIGGLMQRLWPDLDGDAARNAFDLALHRLRRMLSPADSVILAHGRLRLGPGVWVDSHALECMADAAEPRVGPDEQATRLLLLYRGPFLMDEDLTAVVVARERLRSQFVRLVLEVGGSLRSASRDAVIDLFQRAIEREPLAEPVSCALMGEFVDQGRQSEAVREYHRSRTALAQALGSPPSAAAQRLFARLKEPSRRSMR